MNFKFELPLNTLIINRDDLKVVLKDLIEEVKMDVARDDIMTIKETAEYLKVSIPTVRNLIANKEIPYYQRGQVIRIKRSVLNVWLNKISLEGH